MEAVCVCCCCHCPCLHLIGLPPKPARGAFQGCGGGGFAGLQLAPPAHASACPPCLPYLAGGGPRRAAGVGRLGGTAARAAVGGRCQEESTAVSLPPLLRAAGLLPVPALGQVACLRSALFCDCGACACARLPTITALRVCPDLLALTSCLARDFLQAQGRCRQGAGGRQAAVCRHQREVGQVSWRCAELALRWR